MENPARSFRETNLVLQLIQKSQTKSKTHKLELARENRGHFLYALFCPKEIFLNICVLSQCIVY